MRFLFLLLICVVFAGQMLGGEYTQRQHDLMKRCIQLAYQAKARGNYPFAALLVRDDRVVLVAESTVNTSYDPTAHSVVNLIKIASRKMNWSELRHCTVYCSAEPCPLCASAIYWAGIPTLVYGCPATLLQKKSGETFYIPVRELLGRGTRKTEVIGPVMEDFAAYSHEDFWR